MAIADNLIVQVYPQNTDTAIKNIVDDTLFSGTGSPTLTTEGGEDAWLIAADTQLSKAVTTHSLIGGSDSTGVTIALRLKRTAVGSNVYADLVGVGDAGLASAAKIGSAGSVNLLRGRKNSDVTATTSGGTYLNTVRTLVYRIETKAASAQDFGKIWVDTIGRVGTAEDYISAAANLPTATLNTAYIEALTGSSYTLLDFAYWNRELTDQECSDVADSYRATMPAPAAAGTTVNATLATISVSTYTATIIASSPTIVNATLGTIGVSAFDATIITDATITIGPLKNNTTSPWANQALDAVDVYSLSTGELVVRKTGLSTDGAGYCTFSDAALAASTEYKVTVTIGTDDGVKRHTAG